LLVTNAEWFSSCEGYKHERAITNLVVKRPQKLNLHFWKNIQATVKKMLQEKWTVELQCHQKQTW